MSYTTDLINQRRGQITGSQIDGSQVDRKPSEKLTFTQQIIQQRRQNFESFDNSRRSVSAEPVQIAKPEEKSFFKKTSDFLGIGTGELKRGVQSAVEFVTKDREAISPEQVVDFGKNIFNSAKQAIIKSVDEDRQRKKEYFGEGVDLNKLTYSQIRDYQSDRFLDIVRPDIEEDLKKLESKPNKSRIDNYRIKNIRDTLGLVDEAKNAPRDQKKKYDSVITGLALSRGTGALTAGLLNIGESFFDFVKWRGDVADAKGVSEFSEKAGDRIASWADEVRPNNPQFADKLLEGAGSTIPFYVTGLGVSSLAGRLATVSPKIAQVIGVGSSAFMEAGLEAGTTYQSNIDRGMDHEEADKRASRVFAGNILFNYFTNKVGLFNDGEGVKRFIMSGMGEGTQESWQNALQNVALDQPATEGMGETFLLSFITGAGLNQFGSVVQDPAVRASLNEEDLKKLDKIAEAIETSGGDPDKFNQALEEQGIKPDTQTATEEKPEEVTKEGETQEVTETPSPTDGGEVSPGTETKKEVETVSGGEETFDFSSTQLNLPEQTAKQVTDFGKNKIDQEDLFKDPEANYEAQKTGLENEPHITVLYGLDTKEAQDVRDIVESSDPIEVEIGEVSIFEGEESDVVKADITGDALRALNKKLDDALDTPGNEFPDYQPHVTIAYVQKGAGQKYVGDKSLSGQKITLNELTFSSKDGTQTTIPLLGKKSDKKTEKTPDKKPVKKPKTAEKTPEATKQPEKKQPLKEEVKKEVGTLPKDVSVQEESKAVGAKRIAPDRTVHQQLTPESSIKKLKSSISESIDLIEKNRPVKASKNVVEQFDEVESKVERGTATESEKKWYDRVKDQMIVAKAYAQLQDFVGNKDLGKTQLLEKAKEKLASEKGVSNYYIRLVKKDISKGYKFPEAVIAYDRSFTIAENSRARYEKGLRTSFSSDDERIVFDETGQISGGIKRQDGNEITPEQKKEIVDGVVQTQEALGINLNKIAEEERWVYSHLNDKNPFLTAEAGGLYRKTADGNISISVGGVEGFWTKEDGKKVRKKVNTTVAHELGHALDYKAGQKIFPNEDIYKLRRSYNPIENMPRSSKYWSSNSEIKARSIEQYVAIKNGHESYYEREAYWKKEDFDSIIVPMVEKGIDTYFSEYKGKPTKPKQVLEVSKTTQEEVTPEEKPIPKKELAEAEKKIVKQKEPEVKQEQKPKKKYEAQEGGQTKASKVAVSIEQKLGEKLENVAGFESINIKDQIKRAEDLLNKNLIRARGMISGKIPLPDGLRAGAFIKAVEVYAQQTGDMSLLRSLAVSPLVSETSIHAQELRLLAERDENSVLTKIQSIANERAKIAEKKYGQKVDKLLKDETKKIKDSIKKVDKHNWSDFLKSIEC